MLTSPRTIMPEDSQLNLSIDTGEGRNVKARQNLAMFPKFLATIVVSYSASTGLRLRSRLVAK